MASQRYKSEAWKLVWEKVEEAGIHLDDSGRGYTPVAPYGVSYGQWVIDAIKVLDDRPHGLTVAQIDALAQLIDAVHKAQNFR